MIEDLKKFPAFNTCSDSFFNRMERDKRRLTFGRRQLILLADDPADRFYLIDRGWVKLFRETIEGTEAIIDILNTGQLFGDTALFHDDSYPFSAEAAEPCTLISLPLGPLREEITENSIFAMSMLTTMARYRRQQDLELEHRTLQNAPQRIGCFLLRLTNQDMAGPAIIDLPYDKTLVASRLGMKPETFSRALAKLKQDTSIEVRGSSIEITDVERLERYACSACSSEFPCKDGSPSVA